MQPSSIASSSFIWQISLSTSKSSIPNWLELILSQLLRVLLEEKLGFEVAFLTGFDVDVTVVGFRVGSKKLAKSIGFGGTWFSSKEEN